MNQSNPTPQSETTVEVLQSGYAEALPQRLAALEAAWNGVRAGEEGALARFHRLARTLAGSAAVFGFPALGLGARDLELLLRDALVANGELTGRDRERIPELLAELHTLLDRNAGLERLSQVPSLTLAPPPAERRVLLAALAGEEAGTLEPQLCHFGYQVERCDEPQRLAAEVAAHPPAALVADLDHEAAYAELALLRQRDGGAPPVLFLSRRDDFAARLRAVRAGGMAFFTRPVEATAVAERLDALAGGGRGDPYRVLIVEESGALGGYFHAVLEQAGMRVRLVTEPAAVMGPLVELQPDLILIDVHLSDCSGLELAAVIRQEGTHLTMPIVFLSTEADVDQELAAMSRDGDDFLTMPVSGAQLAASVAARAVRARQLHALASRDGLTGLLNHSRIKERLAAELSRAGREGKPLSFAMLDLDYFKQVNDRFGHPAGDRVLKALGGLLQGRLRRSDSVGRYGGEEFAVILPETGLEEALEVLEGLRTAFAGLSFHHQGEGFNVTLSGGVAASHAAPTPETILEAADRALYRAKRNGRNRIVAAE